MSSFLPDTDWLFIFNNSLNWDYFDSFKDKLKPSFTEHRLTFFSKSIFLWIPFKQLVTYRIIRALFIWLNFILGDKVKLLITFHLNDIGLYLNPNSSKAAPTCCPELRSIDTSTPPIMTSENSKSLSAVVYMFIKEWNILKRIYNNVQIVTFKINHIVLEFSN